MNKKFSDDKINEDFSGKVQSVAGPRNGAPIGYGVHKLATEGGDPYSAKKTVEEPEPGIQHQPIILEDDVAPVAPPAPKLDADMEFRRGIASTGFRASDATLDRLVAAGMTPGPKVRFDNSILKDIDEKKDDKAANAKVSADPNAGAPVDGAAADPKKVAAAIAAAAKDAPNPNAAPADPATDPAKAAAAANKMEDSSSKKAEATDKAAAAAPAKALAQMRDEVDPLKIDSVRGPSDGAPIGYGVHKLSIEGGNPYAAKQEYRADQPVPGVQNQPIILPAGFAPVSPPAPPLADEQAQYRRTMGETGLRADETGYNKILAPGMTNTPKSRWGFNSVLNDVPAKGEAADKASNAKTKADPNAGAPADDAVVPELKRAAAIKAAAKEAPNPNAAPADPATDPAAVAAAENAIEKASEEKSAAKAAAKKAPAAAPAEVAAPKAALAQGEPPVDDAPFKIESVKGPPGAPISYGVHKLSIEGGDPYAAKQMYRAPEPAPGVQHQPIILQPGVAPEAPKKELTPEMQYRTDVGSVGTTAADASYGKLVAAGMTDTPKVRFNNSFLAPELNATKDAKADAAPAAEPV